MERLSELTRHPRRTFECAPIADDGPFGNGHAAERIVEALCDLCESCQ